MNRKQFIATCACGLLAGCAGTKYLTAPIEGDSLVVPAEAFLEKKYIVVENDQLEYPICLYRFSETEYSALLMKCTHQGTELQVFGDRLQCPAHGSEFTNTGKVQNGPADRPLRTFKVTAIDQQIKIKLS